MENVGVSTTSSKPQQVTHPQQDSGWCHGITDGGRPAENEALVGGALTQHELGYLQHKLGVVMHICNPSTLDRGGVGWEV